MDFTFTPEQDALREQARSYLAANAEPSWSELAELGWTGVSIAEERRRRGARLRRGGGALRGARARALPRPVLLDDRARAARAAPTTCARRSPRARRAGRSRSDRSSRASTAPTGSRSSAATGSTSSRAPSGRSSTRPTRRGRSASSAAASPAAGSPTRLLLQESGAGCSPRSRSRRAGSRAARSSTRSSTHRRASSSARRSACTRPCRTRSRTRTRGLELARSLALWAAWCVAEGDEQAPVAAAAAKAFAAEAAVARLRDLDPGPRRHRLHLGARAPPPVQAHALDRELRRVRHAAPRRGRGRAARRGAPSHRVTRTADPRRLRWKA